MLLRRDPNLEQGVAHLAGMDTGLGAVVSTPRLSTVAAAMGIDSIGEHPEHLDYDWFGSSEQSGWVGGVDSRASEDLVALRLLQLLQKSLGEAPSPDLVAKWVWAAAAPAVVWQKLKTKGTNTGVVPSPIVIVWHMDKSNHPTVDAVVHSAPGEFTLVLKTPPPRDRDGLKFA